VHRWLDSCGSTSRQPWQLRKESRKTERPPRITGRPFYVTSLSESHSLGEILACLVSQAAPSCGIKPWSIQLTRTERKCPLRRERKT
jgi:hypothetical protein